MKRFLITLLALSILSACGKGPTTITITSFDGSETVDIVAELAVTPEEQKRGLMSRTVLPEKGGMMFVFESENLLSFWMKNTLIPLQILFFDAQGNFVSAHEMVPCEADPCMQYRSAGAAKYALEVNPGFREKHSITPGWKLSPNTVKHLESVLR